MPAEVRCVPGQVIKPAVEGGRLTITPLADPVSFYNDRGGFRDYQAGSDGYPPPPRSKVELVCKVTEAHATECDPSHAPYSWHPTALVLDVPSPGPCGTDHDDDDPDWVFQVKITVPQPNGDPDRILVSTTDVAIVRRGVLGGGGYPPIRS